MVRGGNLELTAWLAVNAVMVLAALWMARRTRRERALRLEEQALREEFEAYAKLDPALARGESPRLLARRVCTTVARWSAFPLVAVLLRDAGQRLHVVGSAGLDDLMLLALDAWGERFAREHRQTHATAPRLSKSYPITLGPMQAFDVTRTSEARGYRQVTILPLWSQASPMLGALAVCTPLNGGGIRENALLPLETLALKLGRSLDFAQQSEQRLRAEKMAGLAQLAKGVAHELNNPLTAVLGFAELIAETAGDPRVRQDAVAIVEQSMRIKRTVDSLLQFWRPAMQSDAAVDVAEMLRALTTRAQPELARQGVKLVLQLDEECTTTCARGQESRLLEVFKHLLSNAAQAVSSYPGIDSVARSIRVTLTCDEELLRVSVSDSGAGFAEPARVFDPFYTTQQPGQGQGLGLAVSYGIVREHGGEISAFNLEPHGAAVVVELPLAKTLKRSAETATAIR